MEAIHQYKRVGYKVALYPNRLVIVKKPGIMPAKETTIFLKNVASTDVHRLNHSLNIKTTDGKMIKVEIFGKDADALREQLENLL